MFTAKAQKTRRSGFQFNLKLAALFVVVFLKNVWMSQRLTYLD